jgi:hypothetical protein
MERCFEPLADFVRCGDPDELKLLLGVRLTMDEKDGDIDEQTVGVAVIENVGLAVREGERVTCDDTLLDADSREDRLELGLPLELRLNKGVREEEGEALPVAEKLGESVELLVMEVVTDRLGELLLEDVCWEVLLVLVLPLRLRLCIEVLEGDAETLVVAEPRTEDEDVPVTEFDAVVIEVTEFDEDARKLALVLGLPLALRLGGVDCEMVAVPQLE